MDDRLLRRKLTFKVGRKKVVLWKKRSETSEHVLMKAFLWALYLPEYEDLIVEYSIGDRYKPDVVSLDPHGEPRFWGEAGKVSVEKIESLARRFPRTHFAMAKWDARLEPYLQTIRGALEGRSRRAPFDLISFPPDASDRFVLPDGTIVIDREQITLIRIEPTM